MMTTFKVSRAALAAWIIGLAALAAITAYAATGAFDPLAPPPSQDRPAGHGQSPIDSFEECVRAGYPVAESYPEQCVSPFGTVSRPVG